MLSKDRKYLYFFASYKKFNMTWVKRPSKLCVCDVFHHHFSETYYTTWVIKGNILDQPEGHRSQFTSPQLIKWLSTNNISNFELSLDAIYWKIAMFISSQSSKSLRQTNWYMHQWTGSFLDCKWTGDKPLPESINDHFFPENSIKLNIWL